MNTSGIVTSVEVQKKQKHRYNIYIDEQFAFAVHEDVLMKHQLFKGKHVDPQLMAEVLRDDERQQAYLKTIRWLGGRGRTEKEIRLYLRRKEYEDAIIDECIDRLKKERYVNDERLSKQLMEERLTLQGKGKIWVRQELLQKGVAKSIIQETLESVQPEDEEASASALARKRWRTLAKQENRLAAQRKLYAYLARRGYSPSAVKKAVREVTQEELEIVEFGFDNVEADD